MTNLMPSSKLPSPNSTNPSSRHCRAVAGLLTALGLTLASLALSPVAQAIDPPPDGGYPNQNTADGEDALFNLTTGFSNTAIGYRALYGNTTGLINTGIGFQTLFANTTGAANTATGYEALYSNTTGSSNTATGVSALLSNTTGNDNTAGGVSALLSNTIGAENTAIGASALVFNTTGENNTANGVNALYSNTTGVNNTANGVNALYNNTTGRNNTAVGFNALRNTVGEGNTANGFRALVHNTTGKGNIALGNNAGENLTTGNNNIEIGNPGVAGEANAIHIGKEGTQTATFIAGISGTAVPTGVAVIVDDNGHLGTTTSSARFKEAIKPMDKASEAILALKPVTFRYKHELDPNGLPHFGLVAEEVEGVNRDLVARDDQGRPYSVRYEAVNSMLLNEFLKEHRKVTEQGNEIAELKATVADLKSAVKEMQQAATGGK